ncbi:MAG TPA: ABC-F family ATP-binding cassette domain-containing protein [Geminicoccaceae bacterium]|nr:ABC-F family ATP-binding cassette domain-containing protein [Geminicoccaceae bacterium]
MLHLNDVTLRIAGRPLLEGASCHLPAGQRAGLVGRNGTGKTSLLRLILGELQPDAGSLRLQTGARLGSVAQEAPGGEITPLAAVLAADTERASLLAEAEHAADPHRIAEIQTRLADLEAHRAEARAASILKGLGFADADQHRPLASFSGGWRMRVALAATLFIEPDLLLLDEPTNHLDLEATLWLEEHLKTYPRTLLLVSHDRDLLNSVPQRIIHLEGRKLTGYVGGYDQFERTRREKLALMEKARGRQQAERQRIQAFVDRFRYKASKARQAQSRIKALERMQPIAAAMVEPEIVFSFPAGRIPPPPLITLDAVRVGYGERVVLDRLELRIDPEDRIALLGANGNGKSTFAKLIAGRLPPMSGTLTRARGLQVGFFAQHQIEDLEPAENGLQHLRRLLPDERDERLRARLGRFGLGQHKADTPAGQLSGGEKARLAMTLMCVAEPQILILDEPTNHLDIDSRQALVEAVNEFPGAVMIVSHDRHLVELTADRLWLVADGRVRPWEGDLDDYRRWLLELAAPPPDPDPAADRPERVAGPARRARLAPIRQAARQAEREVTRLTEEKAALDARLADPGTYEGDGAELEKLMRRGKELGRLIVEAENRWLEAEARVEGLAKA